jgi:beta-glucosidase-like glycosyl hydrolase
MSSLNNLLPDASALTLREKLSQLIFVRIGSNLPPIRVVEDDEPRVASLIKRCPVGGLLVFNGGPRFRESLDRLQQISTVPLLVAADIERGVGQQVRGFTLFPHAMAFEQLGSDAAAVVGEFATTLAREARAAGIHISFGPVADVNTNPKNPIIATRAFSDDANRTAELAAAYVSAAEAAGLRTTAKHFPGHGDTHQDSHDSLPSVPRSLEQLAACELIPFRSAVDAGCSLVMTAHVAYPAMDPSGMPATLSRPVLEGVLRHRLGFEGVICSDSLLMAGVRNRFANEEEMALAALSAGVDMLLDINDTERAVGFLSDCVERGTLDERRVDEAFARVWALKRRTFSQQCNNEPTIDQQFGDAAVLAQQIADGAIKLRGAHTTLSFKFDRPLVAILLKPFETPIDPPEQPLAAALRSHFRDVQYLQLGPNADAATTDAAYQLARSADQLLVAMIVRPAAWHVFGLRPAQSAFVRRITSERDVVLASLGVPYALDDFPNAAVRICTYSDVPVSQQALAEFVLNAHTSPTGRGKWLAAQLNETAARRLLE